MSLGRKLPEERFDRTEKLVSGVLTLIIVALFGIYLTLFAFHTQTRAQLRAENCVSASCESPAVKAILNQAILGLTSALAKNDVGDRTLLCTSLSELNAQSPQEAAQKALVQFCYKPN